MVRATYGTAFRAPNLRELYLANQTGFNTISDPCKTPEDAIDLFTGIYDPSADQRDPQVLANCLANGVNPTGYTGGFGAYSVEQSTGGSLTLDPEAVSFSLLTLPMTSYGCVTVAAVGRYKLTHPY